MAINLTGKSVKYLRLPTTNYAISTPPVISAQEGDKNSRFICVSLFDDFGDISLSSYSSARLYATLPGGFLQYADAVIDAESNSAVCKIPKSMLLKTGKVPCNIVVRTSTDEWQESEDDASLTSQTFYIQVFASQAGDESLEGNDPEGLIQKLQKELADVRAALAKRVTGKSFEDYAELVEVLNGATEEDFSVGQHFFIKTLNVPDVWVYGIAEEHKIYEHTDDESFATTVVNELAHVGYYILSALETQKVDLTDYAKKDYYGSADRAGLVKTDNSFGIYGNPDNGKLSIVAATDKVISSKVNNYMPITPKNLDYALKVGLTTNKETLTDDEKIAAHNWLGLSGLVKNTDYATDTKAGLVVAEKSNGLNVTENGYLALVQPTEDMLKAKNVNRAITTRVLDKAVKVGLTTNTETLTDDEKAAALSWLGAVKSMGNEGYRVYTSAQGKNSSIAYGNSAVNSTIPIRGSGANFEVGAPIKDKECANKKYVDDLIAAIEARLTAGGL